MRSTVHYISSIEYEGFGTVTEMVEAIIAANPDAGLTYDSFEFESYEEWGSNYVRLRFYLPETDAERTKREIREAEEAKVREYYDRQQFEALKKKFGEA